MSSPQTESLQLTRAPITETGMLIRKPVAEVFEAIVNPDITTKFWFTRSSGRLAVGRPIRWDWQMYDVSIEVTESGFTGTGDQLVKYVADSTQGFTLMLAGLKALLEHGVRLNLVGDRYPKGVDEH